MFFICFVVIALSWCVFFVLLYVCLQRFFSLPYLFWFVLIVLDVFFMYALEVAWCARDVFFIYMFCFVYYYCFFIVYDVYVWLVSMFIMLLFELFMCCYTFLYFLILSALRVSWFVFICFYLWFLNLSWSCNEFSCVVLDVASLLVLMFVWCVLICLYLF